MNREKSDDRIEEMIKKTFGSKVPEKYQFRIPESEFTVRAESGNDRFSPFVRKTFSAVTACAAAVLILMPAAFALKHYRMPEETVSKTEMTAFEKYLEEFNYAKSHNTYESIYRSECGEEPELFKKIGMLPEAESNDNYEVFARTETDGETTVYTRQCYAVWYDSEGEICAVMPSSAELSASDTEGLDFNGLVSAEKAVNKILSAFRTVNSKVLFEGVVIRPGSSASDGVKSECSSDMIRIYLDTEKGVIPAAVFKVEAVVNASADELFGSRIPETSMNIECYEDRTEYSTVIIYNCSGKNAVRIKNTETENIWTEKAERE